MPLYPLIEAKEIASRLAKLLISSNDRIATLAEVLAREIFQIDAPELGPLPGERPAAS
jgi:hypothetical protein